MQSRYCRITLNLPDNLTRCFIVPSPTHLEAYGKVEVLRKNKTTKNLILALNDKSIRTKPKPFASGYP